MITIPLLARHRSGWTLVELLIVIVIVGALVALLLPAVQSAREAARVIVCKNNLRQLAVASLNHGNTQGQLPGGGWGHGWVGLASHGSGRHQPGGWAYQILPFLELETLHDLEIGSPSAAALELVAQRLRTPVTMFTCPSRREPDAWQVVDHFLDSPTVVRPHLQTPSGTAPITAAARGDYAINSGSTLVINSAGPASRAAAESPAYKWPNLSRFDGIAHVRRGVRVASIVDGLSQTYLIGEKHLDPRHYYDGLALGDNETLYSGYCSDLHRFAQPTLGPRADGESRQGDRSDWAFGSSHPGTFEMSMCDGAVHSVSYDIDPQAHTEAATRRPPSPINVEPF